MTKVFFLYYSLMYIQASMAHHAKVLVLKYITFDMCCYKKV